MNKVWLLSLSLLLLGLPSVACTSSTTPAAGPKNPPPTTQVSSAPWEQKWANILAEGKKEGSVTAYGAAWAPGTRIAVAEAIKKKYGIELDFLAFSRGQEAIARLQREKTAGLNLADVIAFGAGTMIPLKSLGLLGDIEPLLLLPEVTDPKAWGGEFPFIDKDKTSIPMLANTSRNIVYNTDLVKKGEITTYKDLLKPQYKGKMVLSDPTITGAGNTMFAFLALSAWNPEEAKDFLRQLVKQQEVVILRDPRLQMESVARGKYAISLGSSPTEIKEFVRLGAAIDVAIVKEGTNVSASNGTIAVPARMAHPNAAPVFINWLLTKEGQTLFSRTQDSPSLRIDVPPEGIDPRFVPQPGEKIFLETEESVLFRGDKLAGILNEVIQQASK